MLDEPEALPKKGKCKYEVSRESPVLGAEANLHCRNILAGRVTIAHGA